MLYMVALASAPAILLQNSQLRRPTAKFLIARSAAYSHIRISSLILDNGIIKLMEVIPHGTIRQKCNCHP